MAIAAPQYVPGNDNSATALAALGQANNGYGSALNALQGALKQREATDSANVIQGNVNATQDMLGAINQTATPEELAAKRAGFISTINGLGAGIDRAQVNAALDGRNAILQDRSRADGAYADYSTDRRDQPTVDAINSYTATGDTDKAKALLDQHPEIRLKAALHVGMTARDERTEDREDATRKLNSDISYQGTMGSAATRNAATVEGQLKVSQAQQRDAETTHLDAQKDRALQVIAAAQSNHLGSAGGYARVMAGIKEMYGDNANLAGRAREMYRDSVQGGKTTTDAFLSGLPGISERTFIKPWTWNGGANNAVETMKTQPTLAATATNNDLTQVGVDYARASLDRIKTQQQGLTGIGPDGKAITPVVGGKGVTTLEAAAAAGKGTSVVPPDAATPAAIAKTLLYGNGPKVIGPIGNKDAPGVSANVDKLTSAADQTSNDALVAKMGALKGDAAWEAQYTLDREQEKMRHDPTQSLSAKSQALYAYKHRDSIAADKLKADVVARLAGQSVAEQQARARLAPANQQAINNVFGTQWGN